MKMYKNTVILKSGKDKAIRNRHHWIFSGAISHLPSFEDGDTLPVSSADGDFLGIGYFNSKAKITGRMLAFEDITPQQAIEQHLHNAISLRHSLFDGTDTNSYRLVNGEGDLLPGLIIDRYADVYAVQISTLGMQILKPLIVDWIVQHCQPSAVYEKSNLPSRKEEGLTDEQGLLYGELNPEGLTIKENGLPFHISIPQGQKTGFFLDHRESRQWMKQLAKGKKVLNCFAYTGGFSVYAAAGGAIRVDSLDISDKAIQLAEQNMLLNGFSGSNYGYIVEDVFKYLRTNDLDYNLVILDPPAFAKRQKDIVTACRGYKDINRVAMQKMPPKSWLLTSSCSYHVDENLFQTVVFQAAVEAKRTAKIMGRHRQAPDHPINICHKESDYLKTLLLYLE